MLVQKFFQEEGDLFTVSLSLAPFFYTSQWEDCSSVFICFIKDYNIGLLQALVIYHAPLAISDVQELRESAFSFVGTLVMVSYFIISS